MLQEIGNIIELIIEYAGIFLAERYVFLEQGLEERKQRLFHIISIILIFTTHLLLGDDAAVFLLLVAGGLNISLARTEHRIRGFFLSIPITGIQNGLVVPILFVPLRLGIFTAEKQYLYVFTLLGLLLFLLLLFAILGRNWRRQFREEMKRRHLHSWERFLLCIVGLLMLIYSNVLATNATAAETAYAYGGEIADQFATNLCLMGSIALVLTITIIVLVMQGNKRSHYHEQVSAMQVNIIMTMADIVESRDENTGGHIRRTAKYVEITAKALKRKGAFPNILTDRYLSDMIIAAPLHDIGKVHISDIILNKPGKLTDEEFAVMKSHAAAGRDLLQQAKQQLGESSYLNIAEDMAAYHHEWWNGNGYPDGISGEDIPLCARIMAVADVFDALVSKRCYKKAMPLEKAYAIIQEESGTHFDPAVVEAFFESTQEIEAVLHEFDSEE